MMRRVVPMAVLVAAALGAQPARRPAKQTTAAAQPARPAAAKAIVDKPPVSRAVVPRASMKAVETAIDQRLERAYPEDAFILLGNARGVYLDGYGAVFTAEVNLVNSPGLSPFHQKFTPEELARTHSKKVERVVKLKDLMKTMLVSAAAELRSVPMNEQIVLGVSLFNYHWETTAGLPSQIVMQATRQQLLSSDVPNAVRMQEF